MKLTIDRNARWTRFGFVLRIDFGPDNVGAGYQKRGRRGRTFFVAWRSGSREWSVRHRGGRDFPLELGLTGNANRVPYAMESVRVFPRPKKLSELELAVRLLRRTYFAPVRPSSDTRSFYASDEPGTRHQYLHDAAIAFLEDYDAKRGGAR